MRYTELRVGDKIITSQFQIEKYLKEKEFYWIIDSEIENATIEIKKNTIIWHSGTYFSGNWHYGIFKDGYFYGNWANGIFENGEFKGRWKSGINLKK